LLGAIAKSVWKFDRDQIRVISVVFPA